MRPLRIRGKLLGLVMVATVTAVVLSAALLTVVEAVRLENRLERDVASLARIVADNVSAALAFEDDLAAHEILDSLAAKEHLVAACVYDDDDALFESWSRRGGRCPATAPAVGSSDSESLGVVEPVEVGGSELGHVLLVADFMDVEERLRVQVLTLFLAALGATAVAMLVALRLQRVISQPIGTLAATAAAVTRDEDYSLRARRQGDDELGELVTAFNTMLERIEERDLALSQAKQELEVRVAERTRELAAELVERRRAEAELAERNRQLADSNRELDDFAYVASHDLKEPLRGIHNYAGFLIEDSADRLDEEGRERLATMMRLTKRLERLIDTLLHYSRVGRVDLAVEEVELGALVAEVVDSLAPALGDAVVTVHPLPAVRCDRARIGEVFRNLIVNGIKYNERAEKQVEVGASPPGTPSGGVVPRPEEGAVLWVRDNGIGIAERHREVIFDIFKRLHPRDAYGGGSGAGLTIVKKVVERHGGRVWLESDPGSGTTFFFTLHAPEESPR
ncbi:MAG TPA: ATP-binding protein [Thermoanaerobaculia bacterium]|nr:ATP-binding protein [Thermoanaerobaculia bacterium]